MPAGSTRDVPCIKATVTTTLDGNRSASTHGDSLLHHVDRFKQGWNEQHEENVEHTTRRDLVRKVGANFHIFFVLPNEAFARFLNLTRTAIHTPLFAIVACLHVCWP